MTTFRVGGTVLVQFWFHVIDGGWWYWSSLGAGNWDLSSWVHDVDEVRVRAASGESGPIIIQDFHILD